MKISTSFALLLAGLLACALWTLPAHAAPRPDASGNPPSFRTDRILVKPATTTSGEALRALHSRSRTQVLRQLPQQAGGWQVVKLPPGVSVDGAIAEYRASGLVAEAEPDYKLHVLIEPNDFRFWDGSVWSLKNNGDLGGTVGADIDAAPAWDIQRSASNIIVAVIDTGVRYTHEDLASNMWINPGENGLDILGHDKRTNGIDDDGNGYVDDVHGINAMLDNGNPNDDYGHGTHVAGIIGGVGNNTVGVVGVCWQVQMMSCKFIDTNGDGTISDAITCIDYARVKGAKIINASWGSQTFTSQALRDAVLAARNEGIIFVAAAGNNSGDNDADPLFPASYEYDNIISVAATDRNDAITSFSNFGTNTVDIGAPGAPVFSCWNGSDSDYQYYSGTSMAAPHVVGACALVWQRNPGLTAQQVIQKVLAGAEPVAGLNGKCVTGGRLNLLRALGGTIPPSLKAMNVTNGVFKLTVAGCTNKLTIEVSTNLTAWIPVTTNNAPSDPFTYFHTNTPGWPRRFYRAFTVKP